MIRTTLRFCVSLCFCFLRASLHVRNKNFKKTRYFWLGIEENALLIVEMENIFRLQKKITSRESRGVRVGDSPTRELHLFGVYTTETLPVRAGYRYVVRRARSKPVVVEKKCGSVAGRELNRHVTVSELSSAWNHARVCLFMTVIAFLIVSIETKLNNFKMTVVNVKKNSNTHGSALPPNFFASLHDFGAAIASSFSFGPQTTKKHTRKILARCFLLTFQVAIVIGRERNFRRFNWKQETSRNHHSHGRVFLVKTIDDRTNVIGLSL